MFGRQPLAVKICSCPKRDKAKEEQQNENEKKVTRNPRSRASGGSLSVRVSKVPNNASLKDMQVYFANFINFYGDGAYAICFDAFEIFFNNE